MSTPDPVNHPQHYLTHRSGVECITITEHMSFCLGNAIKYIWRADAKGDAINDLAKAAWYLEREIVRRKALADIENARLIGVIADCLDNDLVTKTASSPTTGNTLAYAQAGDAPDFITELRDLLNRRSMENGSDTPEFILAQYLTDCLRAWNRATKRREDWYGRTPQEVFPPNSTCQP